MITPTLYSVKDPGDSLSTADPQSQQLGRSEEKARMELGLQEGVKAPTLENDAHGLGTVTVGLEILIRESIWHLCITEINLGAAFDEGKRKRRIS